MDMWNLLWITGMTDFVIKFATIVIKALVTMLPKQILPYKKKVCNRFILAILCNGALYTYFYCSSLPLLLWLLTSSVTMVTGKVLHDDRDVQSVLSEHSPDPPVDIFPTGRSSRRRVVLLHVALLIPDMQGLLFTTYG